MQLPYEVSHETKEGNRYLIAFNQSPPVFAPYGITTPLVYIELYAYSNEFPNNSKFFLFLADTVKEFMDRNDVILCYECDTLPIRMREKRKMTPQRFRCELFYTLYEKYDKDSTHRDIYPMSIGDIEDEKDYISLITNTANKDQIRIIKENYESHGKTVRMLIRADS